MRRLALLVTALVALTACSGSKAGGGSGGGGTTAPVAPAAPAKAPPVTSSPGCTSGSRPPAGQSEVKMTSAGVERSYQLYVPASYDGTRPVPVVFNFHGYGSAAIEQMVYGDFRPLSEREGFVIVAPQGQGKPAHFNLLTPPPGEADDIAFALDLLGKVQRDLCLDNRRVYSTGMSNGGAMSTVLACRAADRFAAVGAVAALVYVPPCETPRPVPVAAFAGTADPTVPFNGGRVSCCGNPTIPAATDTMNNFAAHHGCAAKPVETTLSPMVRLRHSEGCRGGAVVDFYVIEGGGHTWPGSAIDVKSLGVTTKEISATDTIWAFFKAHPLPA